MPNAADLFTPPPRRRLYLMRHGAVDYFLPDGTPLPPHEVPLNAAGRAQADAAGALAMLGRQLVRQDRDEDQVVDAEDDFHDHEGHEGRPGGRIAQQGSYAFKHRGSRM